MSAPKPDPTARPTAGELLAIPACAALFLPPALCALFWLSCLADSLPLNLVPGLAGLTAAVLLLLAAHLPAGERRRSLLRRTGKALTALSLIVLAAALGWNGYRAAITIDGIPAHQYTNLYLPFNGDSQIARLEGEASLRFSSQDDLPALSGDLSLFPVYSAMVNAVYPSDIPVLNFPGGPFQLGDFYGDLARGEADILFTTVPAGDPQWEDCYPDGSDTPVAFQHIPLGGEALVFFTSAANPMDGLTQDQLRGIYSGAITNWSQVGGEDIPILPYQQNAQAELERFMGPVPLAQPLTEVRRRVGGSGEYLADYRNTPGAIGFAYYTYAAQFREKHNIKLLAVDGVSPDKETIGQGSYPVTDDFYMVLRQEEHTEEMDRFLAWTLGPEGQTLIAASGYAPLPHP